MTSKHAGFSIVAGAAMLAAGCLQKDTTHTLCLSPDGAVTWIVAENNVYSDEGDAAKRTSEEQTYITAASAGRHGVALALEAMDPMGPVRTRVLRDEAPFLVVTDAKFHSIERVMTRLFGDVPGAAAVNLAADGRRMTLKMTFDFSVEQPENQAEQESPVSAIVNDMDHLAIILTQGRFVAATGFDLESGIKATVSEDWVKLAEKAYKDKGTIEMMLTWEQ